MLHFTKLHGNGNDFILIDEYKREVVGRKAEFASRYCDRRFGIGGDGVLFLGRSEKADIRMQIFNSDGTEAEMCGNGVRCLVKYSLDRGYVKTEATVETMAGVLSISSRIEDKTWVRVNMGMPAFQREKIPAIGKGEFLDVNMHDYSVSAVSTGVVACAAVAHRLGKTGNRIKVNTRGGELMIYLTDETAFMEGPAERVFD